MKNQVSTGFTGLDQIIDALRIGDNVVWQIDEQADYQLVADRFCQQ